MLKFQINALASLFFILSFLGTTTYAQDSGRSVQDMIQHCQPNDRKIMHCIGMGSGVSVMMMLNVNTPGTYRICTPDRITNAQIVRIFLNWADKNPKKWDAPGPIGFALALEEAYPCN